MRAVKKIFSSFLIFAAVFIVISVAADIRWLHSKTTSLPGNEGWKGMADFRVFWTAGRVMSEKMENSREKARLERPLYDKEESFYHFRYSPVIALFFTAFGNISYPRISMALWLLVVNGTFLIALLLAYHHMKKYLPGHEGPGVFMLWAMFLGTLRYYLVVICQGQVDGLAALLLVVLLISYIRKRSIVAGIIFALLLQIKPFFAPVGLYFLFEKRYKIIISSIVSFLLFLVIPVFFLGFSETFFLTRDWSSMLMMSVPSQVLNYKNQSLSYALTVLINDFPGRSILPPPEKMVILLSGIFTFGVLILMFMKSKALRLRGELHEHLSLIVVAAVSVVFSAISWEAYYTFLLIPIAMIFVLAWKTQKHNRLIFYLAGYFLFMLSVGTDITKFIPVVGGIRYTNISIATLFLFTGIFDLYLRLPVFKGPGVSSKK